MITEHDLQEAIAECEGQRNPSSSTCMKLAAFYTIRDKMYPSERNDVVEERPTYSRSAGRSESMSEFRQAAMSIDGDALLSIMDELMDAVKITVPRLYKGVLRKMTSIN